MHIQRHRIPPGSSAGLTHSSTPRICEQRDNVMCFSFITRLAVHRCVPPPSNTAPELCRQAQPRDRGVSLPTVKGCSRGAYGNETVACGAQTMGPKSHDTYHLIITVSASTTTEALPRRVAFSPHMNGNTSDSALYTKQTGVPNKVAPNR